MNQLNKVIHGDCLEIMKFIPDSVIDMILVDLPFGVTQNSWDQVIPFEPMWSAFNRVCKENAAMVFMATFPFAAQLVCSNLSCFRYDLVWSKNKSTGFLNAKRMPLRSHELILVFYRKLPVYNPQKSVGHKPVNYYTKHTSDGSNYGKTKLGVKGGGSTERYPKSVMEYSVVNNDSCEKYHSTQKPVNLFEDLIKTYTHLGHVILDPCIGSGTTGLAATNAGRNFVGIERELKFCEIARKRILSNKNR